MLARHSVRSSYSEVVFQCWVKKSQIFLGSKIIRSEIFWVKENLGRNFFWVKKCFGSKKIRSDIFGGKKNVGRKFGLAEFYFSLIRFDCYVAGYY